MNFTYVIRSLCGVEFPKYLCSYSSRGFVNNQKSHVKKPIITLPNANFSLACCKRGKKHIMIQSVFSRTSNTNISKTTRLCIRSSTSIAYSVGLKRQYPFLYTHMEGLLSNSKSTCFPKIISVNLFHTSPVRMVPPLIFVIAKTAAKMLAIITGRGFRKWWTSLPTNKKLYFLDVLRSHNGKVFAFIVISTFLLLAYYESHVQETPFTHRRRFIAFTKSQFEEIADFEFKMVVLIQKLANYHINIFKTCNLQQYELYKQQFLPTTHPHYERVHRVTERLLSSVADLDFIKNKTFSIAVLKSDEENAFVLPQGQIFVFEGILRACKNDDQLAVIMAHEMAHCIMGHASENVSFAHLLDFVAIAFLAAIWAFLPSDLLAIVTQWFFHKVTDIWLHLPFSRKLETEADEIGLQLAAKACFDVRESSAFWAGMSIQNDDNNIEWLSTHPSHSNRSNHLDSLMEEALQIRKQCGCSDLPSMDPRKLIELLEKKEIELKKILPESRFVQVVPK